MPDFSQKVITHRHMDDGTVDVFTQHHQTDGNTTYFERLNIPESEVALELDGPCSQGQRNIKGGSNVVTVAANETQQSIVSADSNLVSTQTEQDLQRRKRIIRRTLLWTILAAICVAIAALSAEFILVPALVFFAIAISSAIQLLSSGECRDGDGDSSSSRSTSSSDDSDETA